jgi:O-antigen ligase
MIGKDTSESGFVKWCIGLLIMSVAISPRIPLPLFIPGRTFDLRIEDILISLLLAASVFIYFANGRKGIQLTPIGIPIGIYLTIVILTTLISTGVEQGNSLRILLYIMKEVEFFALALLIANWVNNFRDLEWVGKFILIGGGLNVGWAVVQVLTAHYGSLIDIPIPEEAFRLPESRKVFWHGVCSIGERSPFSVAGFFALISFLSYAFFFFGDGTSRWNRFFLVLGMAFSACSVLTGAKIAFAFFMIGFITMVAITTRDRRKITKSLLLIAVAAVVLVGIPRLLADRAPGVSTHLFQINMYKIDNDRLHRWKQKIPYGIEHSLTGIGKGNQLYIKEDGEYVEEAHNHYIKVFVESGIFGLAAFLFLLGAIAYHCIDLLKKASHTISRVMAGATLSALFGLSVAAVVQDAFKPVLPNEIFWIFVGLSMAALRMEKETGPE